LPRGSSRLTSATSRGPWAARGRHFWDPAPETRNSLLSRQCSSGSLHIVRYPCGKRSGDHPVCTRLRMDFLNRCKPVVREQARKANEGRPDPSVHKGYFAIDHTARQHIRRSAHRSGERENSVRLRVRPPVSLDGLPGNKLDQIGYGTVRAFQPRWAIDDRPDPEGAGCAAGAGAADVVAHVSARALGRDRRGRFLHDGGVDVAGVW
jgi:hypothetical protein